MCKRNTARLREAATGLIVEVFRMNGRLLAAGDELVGPVGLSSARWQVLGAIALSPMPLPVAHLARSMGLARQSVQRLVNEMMKDGLVQDAPNPNHRRAKLILLTDRGAKTHRAAMDRQAPWVEDLAGGLSPEAIISATGTLRKVRTRLESNVKRKETRV
jgi:DNA-binding MarR family transcriptional regulator